MQVDRGPRLIADTVKRAALRFLGGENMIFPDLNSVFPLCPAKEGGEDSTRDTMKLRDEDDIKVLSDVTESALVANIWSCSIRHL